ncbi:nucleotidyltransferase family protein [Acidiphilium sp. PA]|uniref:nucleotidyltransferase family protein n=1 Tax=Acidiphilium sp. PA TaxID=2871705 RepID=UPI002244E258|nr:nucleotidyltransferase family protein [Acidiphilium sp. PA]MCW8307242.1 nucleotidyltransferase family protein [Acidiphilium sp. PA]
MDAAVFGDIIRRNTVNRALLERLPDISLADAWLTAGCLFQTVWNLQTGRPPDEQIVDHDVFYYDPADLSWEAEDRVIRRVAGACADLGVTIDVKNQARVHLWYRDRFGTDYPVLRSSEDGMARFPVRGTCVGIRAKCGQVFAPFGLVDIAEGILRPNPDVALTARLAEKCLSYQRRWPHLRIEPG